jgi:RHS repeat-associated protein
MQTFRPSRLRTAIVAVLLSTTGLFVTATPTELPVPRPEVLAPAPVAAAYCASGPSFQGRLTSSSSSTTAISASKTGNVFGYISDVVDNWSCTAFYRYDGLAWATNASGTHGNFDWGTLIDSITVGCNWAIGSTDYLKANKTNDCPDSDAEYAMPIFLADTSANGDLLEGIYHQDASPDGLGDFMFIHSDCDSYYGDADGTDDGERIRYDKTFSTGNTSNRPGANCDPLDLDGTNTSQTIVVDGTDPVGVSIAINSGAATTGSSVVTLDGIAATDNLAGVSTMRFSNDGSTWSGWETYASTRTNWDLTAYGGSGGDGTKTVSVEFQDANGNWPSTAISDTIVLDTVNPVATISINSGAATTASTSVILDVTASDATSGIVSTEASNDNVSFDPVSGTSVAWTLPPGDGPKTVWYRATDGAGRTTTVSDTISLVTDWVPGAGPSDVVTYQAEGWKYEQVSQGAGTGFEAPTFDDASWPDGTGAFASGGSCSVQNDGSAHTSWSVNTDMLVRRHVSLSPGTTGVQVWVAIDNDIIGIYWNGTQIGGSSTHENCPTLDSRAFSVSASLVAADNVLAIRARDRGVESYFDARVLTGGMPIEPALDGTIDLENGATGGDPVQTFSGAFTYSHTDIAIAGLGPSPLFTRSYNSEDTRLGPLGPGWTDSYYTRLREPGDGSGDLLFVRPDGNTDRFTRNNDETFSPSPATYATLVRNPDLSYTVTELDQRQFTFDAAGKLTAIVDRYGNTSAMSYDANGRLISISDPAGRGDLTLAYTDNRLTSVTDWLTPARTVTYGYDADGRLETVTDREGQSTTYAYDGTSSRVTSITDARDDVALTLTYDAQGRVASQKDAQGLTTGAATTFDYQVNVDGTRLTTVTHPPTSFEPSFTPTIEDEYTSQGWLTQRTTTPSSTETLVETYTYDGVGNRDSVTDARGNETDYCYDVSYSGSAISGSRGNLTRVIGPAATMGGDRVVTLRAYDSHNNLIQTVSPAGVPSGPNVTCSTNLSSIATAYATDFAYDAAGSSLLSSTARFTDPDTGLQTAVTKYEFGDASNPGRVTRLIPPRGNTGGSPDYSYATTYTYHASGVGSGMLAEETDALGDVTTFDYDEVGRLTASVDPLGNEAGATPADHETLYEYNAEDRVRFVTRPAPTAGGSGLVTETRYDEVGNPVVRIDPAGQVTTYAYDERDGLFQVTESADAWTDPASPPTDVTTTEYAYDAAGNVIRATRALDHATDERATAYVYDGRGLRRAETQYPSWPSPAGSLVTTNTYDANGNRATLIDPLGQTTTYGYDRLNRLTSIDYSDSGTADVAYAYDANSNRTSMDDGTGTTSYAHDERGQLTSVTTPGSVTVAYRYDLDGNRRELIYPDATAVDYTFDEADRMSSLTDWASRSVTYSYFSDGRLETATNADGSVTTYGYDNARRAADITDMVGMTTIAEHAYTLDPLGNVTGLNEGSDAWTYGYDHVSRLTDVSGPDGTRSYGYDAVGNRTSATIGGNSSTATYDSADRITATGSTSITVDDAGNTTAKGSDAFSFDQANRMVSASVGAMTETYAYDGDGVRFSSQVSGQGSVRYVTDVASSLPRTIDDGTRKYVWGLDLAYNVDGSTLAVYHADRLGSVRVMTDNTGVVTDTYRYDEAGLPTVSSGASGQPFRFTGEPLDSTGLTYLRARYYDSQVGRFITRDPFGGSPRSCQTQNRYSYATNNPTRLVDPSGRDPQAPNGDDPGYVVLKCLNAAGQVTLEIYAAGSAGTSLGAFIFGGELIPGIDVLLLLNASYNAYVALNNVEYVKQSILYCTGDRTTAPTGSSANGPDFRLPPIPPVGPVSPPIPVP